MSRTMRLVATVAVGLSAATAVFDPITAVAGTTAPRVSDTGQHGASPDFNGDGFDDLVIGAPFDSDRGAVTVLYGSATGVVTTGAERIIHAHERDGLGFAVAGGDFDADGFDDLAAGSFEDYLSVVPGSADGLDQGDEYRLTFGVGGMPPTTGDDAVEVIVIADFNDDGFDDVAASSPYRRDDPDGVAAGGVVVISGGPSGLDPARSLLVTPAALGDEPGKGEQFGTALAAGDANGDGFPDLAIGVSHHEVGSHPRRNEGAAFVVFGSSDGLQLAGHQLWTQDSPGIEYRGQEGERFGEAVDLVDLHGDGYAELVIGAPYDVIGTRVCGSVTVLPGGPDGPTAQGSQRWHRGTPHVAGRCLTGVHRDHSFGWSISSGDIDGDGYAELLVGAPYALIANEAGALIELAGGVTVLRSTSDGLVADGSQWWDQAKPGIPDDPEHQDLLGNDTAIGDFDGDGFSDAAITASSEDRDGLFQTGQVHILYGSSALLTADDTQVWHPDVPGVPGKAESFSGFGNLAED